MKTLKLSLIILAALLVFAAPVLAQTETPPESAASSWTGVVNGAIVNRSLGGETPGGLALMLHAWDQNFTEQLMLSGQTLPDGGFQFDEVTFDPDLLYAVMLNYDGVTYYSEPARVEPGQTVLDLEVPIYETTSDTAMVTIERMHVFFDAAPGGLLVGEIYSLSNLGDRTVAGAVTLEDSAPATFEFSLPENAADVKFDDDMTGRYVRTPVGFADTAPLHPGNGAGQVVVTYVLPYTDGMTYTRTVQFPTTGLTLLLPSDSGLSLSGKSLIPAGAETMRNGAEVALFTYDALEPGETVSATLSGTPTVRVGNQAGEMTPEPPATRSSNPGIAIGGAVLGLALLAVGVWWYRQPEPVSSQVEVGSTFDELVTQIAALDEARERGELEGEDYDRQRATLLQQAKAVLPEEE